MPFLAEGEVSIPTKDILSWTFDDPRFDPDEPIYIDAKDSSRSISSNQARVLIRKLVAGFHAAGLKKGDCVCLHSFNDVYYPILFLGIIAAGGVFAGTNPSYTQFELVHHIKTAKTKFLITESIPEMLGNAVAAAKESGIPDSKVWIFDVLGDPVPRGFRSWKELLGHGERDWVRFDDEKTSKETTAARLFSSGTTGLPKAAVLSHHNFIAQHTLVHEISMKDWRARRLLCLPMFHAACVPVAHTTPLRAGQVSVIMRRFELEPFLVNIDKFQITDIALVPPIVIAVIMSGLASKFSLKTIRAVTVGAAPLGKDSQDRMRALFPAGTYVNQVWGMTETSCVASMFHYPEDDVSGSVGRMLLLLDSKIVDDDGRDITDYDVRGELCVRGPTIVKGYFENPKANAESFDSEGFFKTGDIVYCDSKTKKWYIVDRKKELIKVRGFQVAPPELETVLLSHPHIIDAAVIGVKHSTEADVELPRAYVVRRDTPEGKALDEAALKKHCGERLAKFKELTGGVKFVDAIPKNASGKILKRVLRDMAKDEDDKTKAKL
ncbi:related to 4-coumarate--CoA ligase [Rhynchosporium graminicola]|uniref:Related to 4-coumarate--CoA ligase n=1 Tax=Rhynchosporium graminicola TaxID=2792576 RepID=A0A1E1K994_9HELO|nr:related to 4-coumarate--CoA ligase [Rhynchosporium commune]